MTRYVILEEEEVINLILWDGVGDYEAIGELVAIPEDSPISIGWRREGEEWIEPESSIIHPSPIIDDEEPPVENEEMPEIAP